MVQSYGMILTFLFLLSMSRVWTFLHCSSFLLTASSVHIKSWDEKNILLSNHQPSQLKSGEDINWVLDIWIFLGQFAIFFVAVWPVILQIYWEPLNLFKILKKKGWELLSCGCDEILWNLTLWICIKIFYLFGLESTESLEIVRKWKSNSFHHNASFTLLSDQSH